RTPAKILRRAAGRRRWPEAAKLWHGSTDSGLPGSCREPPAGPRVHSGAPPPAREIRRNLAGGGATRGPGVPASPTGDGAAQVEAANRGPVIGRTEDRPGRKHLPEVERPVKDIAAHEAERAFEVEGGENLAAQHRAAKIRRIGIDRIDHQVSDAVAPVVPGR